MFIFVQTKKLKYPYSEVIVPGNQYLSYKNETTMPASITLSGAMVRVPVL